MDELKNKIKSSHEEMREKWNRMLPSNELFMDRWEKAKMIGFGEGSSIYDSSVVMGEVKVGKNVWVGPFTLLDGSGGLSIGNGCHISAGVQIYSHDTVKKAISGGEHNIEYASTKIGMNCHLGANSVILKGVSIGDNSIVGAGCIVTKSFPANSIVIGVPGTKAGTIIVDDTIRYSYKGENY